MTVTIWMASASGIFARQSVALPAALNLTRASTFVGQY
jgi:hypothetical protein